MNTLQGRRALVTGSVQGIGLALAKALASEGASVVLHGLPDARLHEAARRSIASVSTRSRASNGRASTGSSTACRRTTTARC